MRDHYWHDVPSLVGMWCYKISENRAQALKILKNVLENGGRRTCDGEACDEHNDQSVFKKFMWPIVKTDSIQHDSYMCKSISGSIPFSVKRESPSKFVGCKRPCTENLSQKCPVDCRPKETKIGNFANVFWNYCFLLSFLSTYIVTNLKDPIKPLLNFNDKSKFYKFCEYEYGFVSPFHKCHSN